MSLGRLTMAFSLARCVARWTWVAVAIVASAGAGCTPSGTSWPRSMNRRAASPSAVPLCCASRSMSPVDICGTLNASCSKRACVPLPAPGGPSITTRTVVPTADPGFGHAS